MKHFLFAVGLGLAATTTVRAQMTLEHSYRADIGASRLSTGALVYYEWPVDGQTPASNALTLYQENHAVLRQLTVPTVAGYTFESVDFVSDKLFNQDNALEYVANYSRQNTNAGFYRLVVVSETGTQLAMTDTVEYDNVAQLVRGSSGIKLLVPTYRIDAAGNQTGHYTKVFALGGSHLPTASRAASTATAEALPYPNPAHERITLPYSVPAGQTATLEVLDLTGRVAKTYTVGAAFDHLLLDARELRAGAYTYRLRRADGTVTAGKRFVVQ
ncbi:T9SS type A sorting domain-containing protein [Hymenobacter sp. ASUV-10]|uniref:T9SS type A sorting domain-containing protein n=1 Tax=Hymenobacter aranciens TaxID=3063996 RepID=A0ABT9B8W4_9BACT|nr:T9SS type A sorting domain-containing protein [Hymenobacter sp. ASUV-10]MDO7874622.1 T9SS type A sorting domain-containing protein [Hymenobacter sp. ASUV-10]